MTAIGLALDAAARRRERRARALGEVAAVGLLIGAMAVAMFVGGIYGQIIGAMD